VLRLAFGGLLLAGVAVAALVGVLVFAVGRDTDPERLDPTFRSAAFALLERAASVTGGGWAIGETARPAWRQDALFTISRLPGVTLTRVSSQRACHVPKRKWRGAKAIDVDPSGTGDQRRAFYLYLKEHARAHGLRSGGSFGDPGPGELGWDPGHLELPGCSKG
jgi:hypothetical protein